MKPFRSQISIGTKRMLIKAVGQILEIFKNFAILCIETHIHNTYYVLLNLIFSQILSVEIEVDVK